MQKSAIALAVAATLAASAVAHAETTFYGSFRMGVQYTDPDGIEVEDVNSPGDIQTLFDDGFWDVTNQSSRWGVRGSEDLGNGLSAIYQMETQVRADVHDGSDFSGRLAWVGLKGGFGAVKLGAQWSPYYNVTGRTDVFNAVWFNSAMYPSGTFRRNNALVYETPDSIGLFKGEAMVNMDGEAGKDSVDEYNLGANFNIGPAGLGVAYLDNRVSDQDQWAVTAGVDFAGFNIAALYEDVDEVGDAWSGLVQYRFGNNIVRGGFGSFSGDNSLDDRDTWALGFQHNLSSRTRVWAEYQDVDGDPDLLTPDQSMFNIGMRHDF